MGIITTYKFGDIEVNRNRVIHFPDGIIGFDHLKDYVLLHDEEKKNSGVHYLQSVDDNEVAFVLIDPNTVVDEYKPEIDSAAVDKIGNLTDENITVFVTLIIPEDITKMSVNLKAPIIINSETLIGAQVLTKNDYAIKTPVYEYLKEKGAVK